jgi:hypothetical protein
MTRAPTVPWRVAAVLEPACRVAGITDVASLLAAGETVRDLPYRTNHRVRIGPHLLHVKRHRHGGLRRHARSPEAVGLERMARAGVRVATCVVEGADRRAGVVAGVLDLAPASPARDLLAAGRLRVASRPGRSALFDLARQVARLHDAGLFHRDLYLDHVFVDPDATPPRVTLIDGERVGRFRGRMGRRVVKDLAALEASAPGVATTDRWRFLLAYLAARSLPADTWARPLSRAVVRKAARIRRHVPRTPVGAAARPRGRA